VSRLLDQVAELVGRESGILLHPNQYSALRAAIGRAVPSGDAAGFLRLAGDPVWGRETVARLVDEITVKETSFFRDRRQLDAIAWRMLLERAHAAGAREIRVWSAACATGQEPYTLAILACEAFAPADPPVRVLGTDIAASALESALAGRYPERLLRGVDSHVRRTYFEEDGDRVVVGERARRIVELRPHNLARDPVPPLGEGPFDLILCRNVLIYFDGETVERVIESLEGALRPGGMLILGSADALCGTARRLARIGAEPRPVRKTPPGGSNRPFRRPLGRAEAPSLEHLDADSYFTTGLTALEEGDAHGAAAALRRALYVDPTFGLAAFTLGRAHEAAGDASAARRAYEQALRTIDLADDRHDHLLQQVELEDVAAACRARLETLR
jgi:chemotaxis methyl-accepting protein methylase